MSVFTVVLDACVLFPAPIRDLLIRTAATGLFAAKWTDEIHDEWIRNLLRIRTDLTRPQLARTKALMNAALPDVLVENYESLIPALELPDPNDRHVLAAAIRSQSNAIVTFNLKDFPDAVLSQYDIVAIDPDDFFVLQLGLAESTVCAAAKSARAALKSPPLSVDDYLAGLARCGLVQTAGLLRPFSDLL